MAIPVECVWGTYMLNVVFIGTSLDGYISDKDGGLDFLHSIPNSQQDDLGYLDFMGRIDALLMGRKTYETVLGFGGNDHIKTCFCAIKCIEFFASSFAE